MCVPCGSSHLSRARRNGQRLVANAGVGVPSPRTSRDEGGHRDLPSRLARVACLSDGGAQSSTERPDVETTRWSRRVASTTRRPILPPRSTRRRSASDASPSRHPLSWATDRVLHGLDRCQLMPTGSRWAGRGPRLASAGTPCARRNLRERPVAQSHHLVSCRLFGRRRRRVSLADRPHGPPQPNSEQAQVVARCEILQAQPISSRASRSPALRRL